MKDITISDSELLKITNAASGITPLVGTLRQCGYCFECEYKDCQDDCDTYQALKEDALNDIEEEVRTILLTLEAHQ